ncbi:MAG: helix-turn-helix domain-containing protein, partial [Deltaproteobacteria bacterium]|nr:helix-turn-helix domain-containing protein [Deltaproteobacteria bacterium]
MVIRFKVTLTPEERGQIEAITKKGKHESRIVLSARALLLCDASQEETLTSSEISKVLGLSERTIDRLKKRFVEEGLDSALGRKPMD